MDTKLIEYVESYPPYVDLVRSDRAGYEPNSGHILPWFLIPSSKMFDANEVWDSGYTGKPLIAFARRQDCDDFACLLFENGEVVGVELIEGWSGGAYTRVAQFATFAEWLKSVEDDILL